MIPAYPLHWPAGWRRTNPSKRARAKFGKGAQQQSPASWPRRSELSVTDGWWRILGELGRLGVRREKIIISTNVKLRNDGLPRSDQRMPDDPGAAVYWEDNHESRCMASDRYDRVADNLAAVAATIEAMRAIERHGGAEILNRAFTGFNALPSPAMVRRRTWREIFGYGDSDEPNLIAVKTRYRELANVRHPDKGGTNAAMAELNAAHEEAQRELG